MNESSHDRPPQEKVCGYEYTVRRGDSFYLIANRLGVPLRDLLEANSDINPARLMVGDVLCIPMEEDDTPPVTKPVPDAPSVPETPVMPESASVPETAPEEELPQELLPAPDENLDKPAAEGDASSCPGGIRYTVAAGETAADIQLRTDVNRYTLQTANPTADLDRLQPGQQLCIPSQSTACPSAVTYVLQPEDTLESAALRLNTSLAALLRANPCLSPSDFAAGRCIRVP